MWLWLVSITDPNTSQERRQLSANIDALIVQTKSSGLRDDTEVKVRRVVGLDKPNVITLAGERSLVGPIPGNFVRHLVLMGPGQKRALAARPRYLEASAVVAFLQAAWFDSAVGGESAHVACNVHVDIAVVEVVEGYVGGRRSVFAGEISEDGAVGQDWVGVALDEVQSGDVNVFDGVKAVAAVVESRTQSREPYERRPLHSAVFLGRLLSRAALPDSAVRVGCKDEDGVHAMLDVANESSTSRGSLIFADLLG